MLSTVQKLALLALAVVLAIAAFKLRSVQSDDSHTDDHPAADPEPSAKPSTPSASPSAPDNHPTRVWAPQGRWKYNKSATKKMSGFSLLKAKQYASMHGYKVFVWSADGSAYFGGNVKGDGKDLIGTTQQVYKLEEAGESYYLEMEKIWDDAEMDSY